MPYRRVDRKYDYPSSPYSCSFGRFDFQPVLTLLLNKGDNEFADQYGFNLNFDNKIIFPNSNKKGYKSKNNNFSFKNSDRDKNTGISYLDGFGLPAYFGIFGGKSKKNINSDAHELNQLENIWRSDVTESDVMRIPTRVRCVKD
jgi:hypothetical protein